eukprot:gb/GFBE01029712.1/.p1 GENE.gb/GFBE01029712.1/~~gb/GFBE01029712.1/.p1  ORF type:complete len:180 (+),score=16.33 gb/GFBE01029712.1/:1-540(+)
MAPRGPGYGSVWLPFLLAQRALGDGAALDFELVGDGFCMDADDQYYDSFSALIDESGYDGTLGTCKSRSASEQYSVGFSYSSAESHCSVNMENGQVPTGFTVPQARSVESMEGRGPIAGSSKHDNRECYRKCPCGTMTSTTASTIDTTVVGGVTSITTSTQPSEYQMLGLVVIFVAAQL